MDFEQVSYAGMPFWKVIAGAPGPIIGDEGPLFRYVVLIEPHLRVNRKAIARQIDATLADPRGWTRGRVRFQRVIEGADTDVLLCSPAVVDNLCAPLKTEGEVSCCNGRRVVINVNRWKSAVPHWPGSIRSYRHMLVNHEFGHRTGQNHRTCPGQGKAAPVMQQQTYGLQGCKANSWPLDYELPR